MLFFCTSSIFKFKHLNTKWLNILNFRAPRSAFEQLFGNLLIYSFTRLFILLFSNHLDSGKSFLDAKAAQ